MEGKWKGEESPGTVRGEMGSLGRPLPFPPSLRSPSATRRWTSLPFPLLTLTQGGGAQSPWQGHTLIRIIQGHKPHGRGVRFKDLLLCKKVTRPKISSEPQTRDMIVIKLQWLEKGALIQHLGVNTQLSKQYNAIMEYLLVLVAQSCPTLCDPKDCSLPGSSVHRIL